MDKLRTYYQEYGHRVASGFVRNGDGLQWVVDALEWVALGHVLATELSPTGVDINLDLLEPDKSTAPLEWVLFNHVRHQNIWDI